MPIALFESLLFRSLQALHVGVSVCASLLAVTYAFSHMREEQVQLVSCVFVIYSARECTYILKSTIGKNCVAE